MKEHKQPQRHRLFLQPVSTVTRWVRCTGEITEITICSYSITSSAYADAVQQNFQRQPNSTRAFALWAIATIKGCPKAAVAQYGGHIEFPVVSCHRKTSTQVSLFLNRKPRYRYRLIFGSTLSGVYAAQVITKLLYSHNFNNYCGPHFWVPVFQLSLIRNLWDLRRFDRYRYALDGSLFNLQSLLFRF